MLPCTLCACSSSRVQLLVNGGFERNLTGWAVPDKPDQWISTYVLTSVVLSGSRSLAAGVNSDMRYLSQAATTVVGVTHRLAFCLSAGINNDGLDRFVVELQPEPSSPAVPAAPRLGDPTMAAFWDLGPALQRSSGNGTFSLSSAGEPRGLLGSWDWTCYQIEFVAAAPKTTVRLGYRKGRNWFFLDNISLTAGGWARQVLS